VAIPQKKLLLYYTENSHYLYYYAKIHKPLKDVIIKIAKQRDQPEKALEGPSEEILGRMVYKRKADYTRDRDSKKPKK
jgi:hypothetical protein